jgi:hypothetical protein
MRASPGKGVGWTVGQAFQPDLSVRLESLTYICDFIIARQAMLDAAVARV